MSKDKSVGEKGKGKDDKVEKKHKKKREKEEDASKRKEKTEKNTDDLAEHGFSLLADEERVNPALSSLFAAKPTPPVRPTQVRKTAHETTVPERDIEPDDGSGDVDIEHDAPSPHHQQNVGIEEISTDTMLPDPDIRTQRKRRRKHDDEEIEDVYMRRLAHEEKKEAITNAERESKRLKIAPISSEEVTEANDDPEIDAVTSDAALSPPPVHESLQTDDPSNIAEKASRTVFLANVSTEAITSKSARKTLLTHLKSILPTDLTSEPHKSPDKLESLRFRSTPFDPHIPKRAAFARGALVTATTKSTNAYAVYSTATLAHEAVRKLNGTVVLDRHLRVDGVADPAPQVGRRCVFVGNLGFVDEENPNEGESEEKKQKKPKPPSDVEEGLWRVFARLGDVESVRVPRDAATRVGKGFAYVQFRDQEPVEAALGLDGKAFPPMLPRKLRVSRVKKGFKKGDERGGRAGLGSQRRSSSGRDAPRLVGKARGGPRGGVGHQHRPRTERTDDLRRGTSKPGGIPNGFAKPESFVFEGHRASSKSGKAGLKLGKKKKVKGAKPTNRSARRGAAFKAEQKKKVKT